MIKIDLELRASNDTFHKSTIRKYRTDKADWIKFNKKANDLIYLINDTNFEVANELAAKKAAEALKTYIETVCDEAIPLMKHNGNRKPNENDEIKILDKLELNLHRKYTRLKKQNKFSGEIVYKELIETRNKRMIKFK